MSAADPCALTPSIGRIRYSRPPTVRMMRQPPVPTPSAMAPAVTRITQAGTPNSGWTPWLTSNTAILPLVFWPSFAPRPRALRLLRNLGVVVPPDRLPYSSCPLSVARARPFSALRRLGPARSLAPVLPGYGGAPRALLATGLSYRLLSICSASGARLVCPAWLFSPVNPFPPPRPAQRGVRVVQIYQYY